LGIWDGGEREEATNLADLTKQHLKFNAATIIYKLFESKEEFLPALIKKESGDRFLVLCYYQLKIVAGW
jgi:hypothetical protein